MCSVEWMFMYTDIYVPKHHSMNFQLLTAAGQTVSEENRIAINQSVSGEASSSAAEGAEGGAGTALRLLHLLMHALTRSPSHWTASKSARKFSGAKPSCWTCWMAR